MPVLSVVHYNRSDWENADNDVQDALLNHLEMLRVTNVHTGQNGDIEFNVHCFTTVPPGATDSILSAALARSNATLAPGTIVELHGHYNTVQRQRYLWTREISSIAFKFSAPGQQQSRYLGWLTRAALPGETPHRLDREINRRRWQGR